MRNHESVPVFLCIVLILILSYILVLRCFCAGGTRIVTTMISVTTDSGTTDSGTMNSSSINSNSTDNDTTDINTRDRNATHCR